MSKAGYARHVSVRTSAYFSETVSVGPRSVDRGWHLAAYAYETPSIYPNRLHLGRTKRSMGHVAVEA